jgi:NAD(P)-dependent dehydrogenase (short-subunit alcohol dehydrogenase family)
MQQGYKAEIATTPPSNTAVLILLDPLNPAADATQALTLHLKMFADIQQLGSAFNAKGGVLISVQDTGGYFGLQKITSIPHAYSAGISGILKTAAHEWKNTTVKAIDLSCEGQKPKTLAQRLVDEILYGSDDQEVGLASHKTRIVLKTTEQAAPYQTVTPKKNAVFVVTGGARGITADCLIALAKTQPIRFVLLGRSPILPEPREYQGLMNTQEIQQALIKTAQQQKVAVTPKQIQQQLNAILATREIQKTLHTLEKLGSEVLYFAVDATDQEKLTATLETVRKKWSSIDGIIHAAGVLADKLILEKTPEQFSLVFKTKVLGLQNLLKATEKDRLSYLLLFSSVAGRYGNIGQCDYAAANEVLNKVAQFEKQRRGTHCLVKAINWGPWDSGMVTPELKALFVERNIQIIPQELGTEFFLTELMDAQNSEVEVVYGGQLVAKPQPNPANTTFEKIFHIHAKSDDYLNSHVIQGTTVLPACLVLDWFMRTIKQEFPNAHIQECRNFKVLRGVLLPNFLTTGEGFHVQCDVKEYSPQSTTLFLQLLDSEKKSRYCADFFVADTSLSFNDFASIPNFENKKWPWKEDQIYANNHQTAPLFHGINFQSVTKLLTCTAEGGAGNLHGIYSKQWPKQAWKVDVLAFDGVLQLLLLWGYTQLQRATLPVGFSQIQFFQSNIPEGELCSKFTSEKIDNFRTRSNAWLFDQSGQVCAVLKGVEMCVI